MYILFFFFYCKLFFLCFFFFQAEDGIRDLTVTGVQTCALPIWCITGGSARRELPLHHLGPPDTRARVLRRSGRHRGAGDRGGPASAAASGAGPPLAAPVSPAGRFQIGRASVGKECRSRWAPDH